MLRNEDVAEVLQRPEVLGRLVGFTDLTALHGQWIHEMVFGDEDYTLQAHRGAFKSSCLAVAIPLYMVLYPDRNVIFLRKTDHDVGEMMNMVAKVLQSDVMRDFTQTNRGVQLKITEQSMDHITTNLWHLPMGAPQLRGLGIPARAEVGFVKASFGIRRFRMAGGIGLGCMGSLIILPNCGMGCLYFPVNKR